MAMKAKLSRDVLTRRLRDLVPEAEKASEVAKLEVAREAARQIEARAPVDTGDYKASIKAGYLKDNPDRFAFTHNPTKDPTAAGIYADYIWRFLEFGTRSGIQGHRNAMESSRSGRFSRRTHSGTPAQPHIFSTWLEYRPKALRKLRAAVNKAVRDAMRK